MKTVLFSYDTPVGTFWIHPEPADRVQLRIDATRLKTYGSAKAAARDVHNRTTGWEPWDNLEGVLPPRSLTQWKRGPATSRTAQKASRAGTGDGVRDSEGEADEI